MHKAEVPIRFEFVNDPEFMCETLEAVAEGCVRCNQVWCAAAEGLGIEVPCCPSCLVDEYGFRYVGPEMQKCASACQRLDCAPVMLEKRQGTCYDLACFFCAVYRGEGKSCHVHIVPMEDVYGHHIPGDYHAVIMFADGSIRDPSEEIIDYAKNGTKAACECPSSSVGPELEVGGCSTGKCGLAARTMGVQQVQVPQFSSDPASPYGGNCLG
jgi:hypothetical protein